MVGIKLSLEVSRFCKAGRMGHSMALDTEMGWDRCKNGPLELGLTEAGGPWHS